MNIMQEFDNDELEFDALAKCSKALSKLDNDTKRRVIQYLLMKYNLVHPDEPFISSSPAHPIVSSPSQIPDSQLSPLSSSGNVQEAIAVPSIIELVKKQYTKGEGDILLMVLYKMSVQENNNLIKRSEIVSGYRNENLYTDGRRKNITSYLNGLVKKSYVSFPTTETILITDAGISQVQAIVAGSSSSPHRSRTSSGKKKK